MTFLLPFLGIGKSIMGWLSSGAKWIFADIHRVIIAALIALCAWFYIGKGVEARRAENALSALVVAKQTVIDMERVSAEAMAAQVAMNKAVTDKQTDIARKADNVPTDIIDRGTRYADSLPAKDYCRKADSPATGGPAGAGDAASDTAVVSVPRADFDILVANTARLVAVRDWGQALIDADLAVPVE